jgi:hypothetical protein
MLVKYLNDGLREFDAQLNIAIKLMKLGLPTLNTIKAVTYLLLRDFCRLVRNGEYDTT